MSGQFSDRVKALGLPLDQLIVVGSGIMGELEIRQSSDVDVILTESTFESLSDQDGWRRVTKDGREAFLNEQHNAEAWSSWVAPDDSGLVDFESLMPDTVVLNDVRFASLDYVRAWKKWYDRQKDRDDVALIDAYLEARS